MGRVWSTPHKCKYCRLKIEYNTITRQWQTVPGGRAHCIANKRNVHEPKG